MTGFLGASDIASGSKLTCTVKLIVYKKCETSMEVRNYFDLLSLMFSAKTDAYFFSGFLIQFILSLDKPRGTDIFFLFRSGINDI